MYLFFDDILYMHVRVYMPLHHTHTHTHTSSLLPAVAYSLLVQLTKHHPLSKPPSDETNSSRFSNEAPPTLTAHVLYCHWVLRYLTLSHLPPDVKRATNSWDITCASPEQIKTIVSTTSYMYIYMYIVI